MFHSIVSTMKVLVSYKERNQVFTLEGNDEVNRLEELKRKTSEKFHISNDQEIQVQKYDAEWDSFIDIENDDAISDRDRLKLVTLPGGSLTPHAEKKLLNRSTVQ